MSLTISLEEAQTTLADLIGTLSPGEEVIITQDDQPVATLIRQSPVTRMPPQFGSAKGTLIVNVEDDEHLKDFAEYMPADGA